MSEPVECSLCGKMTTEYCSTLACRECHVTLTFEECVDNSYVDRIRVEADLPTMEEASQ